MSQHIDEIRRCLFYTNKACEETMSAESGEALRVAWEAYVDNYGKTIDRLISAGLCETSTKSWAYRLKNQSTKDDEGLRYLREARNISQHGLVSFGSYHDPKVVFGDGALVLTGGHMTDVTVRNLTQNGKPIVGDEISFDQSGGKVSNLKGERPAALREHPAEVKLGPIANPEKKTTVPFPSTIRGRTIMYGSPRSLARAAMDALEEIVADFKREAG
ncbi:hypothetical protein J7426_23525 [Tropicibacter sp. R16_0]|uniref:hypothetical protein n=1 Tax=Tropicibacter sp. R16_0 TaxID=2821102 RepID=UPI001ADA54DB|nr:hypothetical protein [Tropicibacter sp. R16_0]MBO9453252.1 hypothetical protein [Tropicibacter sp. R16_0]